MYKRVYVEKKICEIFGHVVFIPRFIRIYVEKMTESGEKSFKFKQKIFVMLQNGIRLHCARQQKAMIPLHRTDSVSYTHLDVYKRQSLHFTHT